MTTTPDTQLKSGEPRLATGSWRLCPAHSDATFAARLAGRRVQGRLPLTGRVHIAEPIEQSKVRLAVSASAVDTGSPVLDRVLAGAAFLDASAYPEISFESDLLVFVPAGWRAIGRLRIKNVEHELACQFAVHLMDSAPGGVPRPVIGCNWVIDSTWVTTQWIPGLSRHIAMTCSIHLDPDM